MADESLVSGIEKLQVEGTQQIEKVNASEQEKSIVPEKLQCDSSESGGDSGSEKEKDAAPAKRGGQEEEKKKEVLKKKKKKGTKKNEGEGSMADKLQCDSSDSKSGSGDDSSGSKSGSGDDSKSESGCANEVLEGEVKKQEKKKGLIEKIREKLSRKPKNETAEVANEEISGTKAEDKQNLDKLQCDNSDSKSNSSADSGFESCSGKEKDTVLKGGAKGDKKKVLRKKIKKKATKKIDGEASTADKLHCDSSDSKSGSGDDSSDSKSGDDSSKPSSKSGSKSGSGDDSKSESDSSSKKERSKDKIVSKEEEKKGEEGNQSSMAETEVPLGTKVDESNAAENLEVFKEIEKDQDEGKKVKEQGVDEQGENEKKSILGKIMEKLPRYYKNGGE